MICGPSGPPLAPKKKVVKQAPAFAGLGDVWQLLAENGYADAASIQQADDEELLSISGIGQATLKKIREATG